MPLLIDLSIEISETPSSSKKDRVVVDAWLDHLWVDNIDNDNKYCLSSTINIWNFYRLLWEPIMPDEEVEEGGVDNDGGEEPVMTDNVTAAFAICVADSAIGVAEKISSYQLTTFPQ